MRKRMYHEFPQEVDFEKKYKVKFGLGRAIRALKSINNSFDNFETYLPNRQNYRVTAKRDIRVEVAEKSVDFAPIDKFDETQIENEGIVDFRISLRYSYLNEKYDRIPIKGDVYLLRVEIKKGILTLYLVRIDGLERTAIDAVAVLIKSAIEKSR